MISKRDVGATCFHNGHIYVIAGRDSTLKYITKSERYIINEDRWEAIADCVTPAG